MLRDLIALFITGTLRKIIFPVFQWLFVLAVLSSMSGCIQWVTPRVQSELVAIKPGEYVLDKNHSTLLFKINHLGFSTFVGRFNRIDASLNINPEDLSSAHLEAVIDMASVDVNNSDFEATLRSRFWFDTAQYPQAYFKTQAVTLIDENHARFSGVLRFMGEEQKIDLEVTLVGSGFNLLTQKYTLGFEAKTHFKRSDFGVDQYIPAVGDDVYLEVHAEFLRQ